MRKNETACFNRLNSPECRFNFLLFAACALLCISPAALAKDKRARNTRAAAVEKRATAKLTSKRESVSRREKNDRRESAGRKERDDRRAKESARELASQRKREVATRLTAALRRESMSRTATTPAAPYLRKTVIVSPTVQANNRQAARPALVNDIVIISEASAPVTSSLPASRRFEGSSNQNMPSIWPVAGNLGKSGFGIRRNPFGGSSTEFHKGQDISAAYGSPVIATADGVVVIAGWLRGYGQVVYIDHGNGISTRYGHLSRLDVIVGQTIKRGQQLGLVGSTGRSTGPHLHYEVRVDGLATNPVPYLPNLPAPTLQTAPGIQ
ncbi:MAG: peptidoglycan DD-metalloendopeptidase family protein [Acidobacteria bacterium]|nr:peptidoglycan DD-metalloendopeptidase family protein [Acidobacteriota bacterium]